MTGPRLLLDISRTVARSRLPAPTGIDRVERAYIDWALSEDALFVAAIDGVQHLLGPETLRNLITLQNGGGQTAGLDLRARLQPQRPQLLREAQSLIRRGAIAGARRSGTVSAMLKAAIPDGGVYLNVGHDNLSPKMMVALSEAGLQSLVMIHDVIPLDHPHFARKGTPQRFRAKLDAAAVADGILANSADTAERLLRHIAPTRLWAAPLGSSPIVAPDAEPAEPPYFLVLGTIEPRKNHHLLMDVWEGFGADAAPAQLWIAGRRGWNNQTLFRRLDQADVMGKSVHELGPVDENDLPDLIAGATAVLFPSLAEGFGLPVAEALARGVPVIASDLPALREVGRDAPDYLPANDTQAWADAVTAYAAMGSPQRSAQMTRLDAWTAPTWESHFAIVRNAIETVLVQSGTPG